MCNIAQLHDNLLYGLITFWRYAVSLDCCNTADKLSATELLQVDPLPVLMWSAQLALKLVV